MLLKQNIYFFEDFAESADLIGVSYEQLIQRILNLGLVPTPTPGPKRFG